MAVFLRFFKQSRAFALQFCHKARRNAKLVHDSGRKTAALQHSQRLQLLLKGEARAVPDLPAIPMVVCPWLLADKGRSNCPDTLSKIPCQGKTAALNRVKHYIIRHYIATPPVLHTKSVHGRYAISEVYCTQVPSAVDDKRLRRKVSYKDILCCSCDMQKSQGVSW